MRDRERVLDAYLIASARLGDRKALETLAQRWNAKLIAHASRLLGDRESARDAVQEGWTEILRGLGRLRDDSAFAAWAYRIVSRRCARQIRTKQGQRRIVEEAALAMVCDQASEGEPALLDIDAVRQAIKTLPPEQRATIALFYMEELSVAEVAVALDVPVGTVKTRLMHARRKLRAVLEGEVSCEILMN